MFEERLIMVTVYYVLIGILIFFLAALVLGSWLRRHPSKENAERSSRVMHFFFFAGMVAPPIVGVFYPGLTHFDELSGLPSLPWKPFFLVLGIFFAIPSLYFMGITNKLLRALGSGTNAFILTKKIVNDDIYTRTRNPMSLGFYLSALAFGFGSGSTFILLVAALGLIPAHIFFLKYFEELELELRFGASYLEYKKSAPFLIPKSGKWSDSYFIHRIYTDMIAFEGDSVAKMYIGNWSDYETMMVEKFGKDLTPHRVKYRTLKR